MAESGGGKKKKRPAPIVLLEQKINSLKIGGDDVSRMEKYLEAKLGILGDQEKVKTFTAGDYAAQFEDKDVLSHGVGDARTVKLCKHRLTQKNYLKKIIHKDRNPDIIRQIGDEIAIMHECIDDHCVQFFCSFIQNDEVHIVMEYMNGGCLDSTMRRVGRIDEPILGYMINCALLGMNYLAELSITHRDIKPSNILVNTRGEVKLCDFGVSKKLHETRTLLQQLRTFVGTLAYMSPERLNNGEYTSRCDIWSIGLSVFELAMGYHPFLLGLESDGSGKKLPPPVPKRNPRAPGWKKQERIIASAVPTEIMGTVNQMAISIPMPTAGKVKFSVDVNDFVAKCVVIDPNKRISLKDCLAHEWIKSCKCKFTSFDVGEFVRLSLPEDPSPDSDEEEEFDEEEEIIDRSASVVSQPNPDDKYRRR